MPDNEGATPAAQRYPLDFDAIHKGQVLDIQLLEGITGETYRTPEYNLACMQLRRQITKECRLRGNPVTVRSRHGALHILMDDEASVYNTHRFKGYGARAGQRVKHLLEVDTTRLSAEQRMAHERRAVNCSLTYQAFKARARQLAASPHVRSTPGLPAGVVPPAAIQAEQVATAAPVATAVT